jgi:hypothetical protein
MPECRNCRQVLDPTDQFCRTCGAAVSGTPTFGWSGRSEPSPEQAARYWRDFFRPFFTMAFIFFGAFFLVAMILVVVWFFMFRR